MNENFNNKTEVIVVGGGPAGISCAITIARAGHEVVLIERGSFAGSKNVFGGAIYAQPTRKIFPNSFCASDKLLTIYMFSRGK